MHSLREAIAFYVERDTDPANGIRAMATAACEKFDDLPQPYHKNINMEPPFGGKPGDPPVLTPQRDR